MDVLTRDVFETVSRLRSYRGCCVHLGRMLGEQEDIWTIGKHLCLQAVGVKVRVASEEDRKGAIDRGTTAEWTH